ncbi:hypothetical protein B0T20DRAFT_467324 [Sordaria brevicollis]|uniref:Uncharacterized protein n=1 Tax=Sordaria brevicollis TaxID=83679 RepID=A0AAE0UDV2_SORBR|nr:hypothetical protein B0T20DRAFT_467324 [Sordaria brevicollis]
MTSAQLHAVVYDMDPHFWIAVISDAFAILGSALTITNDEIASVWTTYALMAWANLLMINILSSMLSMINHVKSARVEGQELRILKLFALELCPVIVVGIGVTSTLLPLSLPVAFGGSVPEAGTVINKPSTGFDVFSQTGETIAVQCCHMWTLIAANRLEAVPVDAWTIEGEKKAQTNGPGYNHHVTLAKWSHKPAQCAWLWLQTAVDNLFQGFKSAGIERKWSQERALNEESGRPFAEISLPGHVSQGGPQGHHGARNSVPGEDVTQPPLARNRTPNRPHYYRPHSGAFKSPLRRNFGATLTEGPNNRVQPQKYRNDPSACPNQSDADLLSHPTARFPSNGSF